MPTTKLNPIKMSYNICKVFSTLMLAGNKIEDSDYTVSILGT